MTDTVAIIIVDTARSDSFNQYAPQLLSRADVVAEQCWAPSSWTPPSHASMLTGQFPTEHGVTASSIDFADIAGETIFDRISQRTVGVSANGFLSPAFGFESLFDEFVHFYGNEELLPGGVDLMRLIDEDGAVLLSEAINERRLRATVINALYIKANNFTQGISLPRIGDYGLEKLIETAKRRITDHSFLFMNCVDVHGPHENLWRYGNTGVPNSWTSRSKTVWEINDSPDPEYLENYRTLYQRSIRYVDNKLAPFVDWLIEELDATVIITADHGEGLDPSNHVFGHKRVSESVLSVPFLLVNPPKNVNIERISLLDIPDVIEWALGDGILPKRQLLPAERLGDPDAPSSEWDKIERAVSTPEEKYRWDAGSASQVPTRLRSIFPSPIESITKSSHQIQLTTSVEEHLRDLGYK